MSLRAAFVGIIPIAVLGICQPSAPSRVRLKVPKDYVQWTLVKACPIARILSANSNDDSEIERIVETARTVNDYKAQDWVAYESGEAAEIISRDDFCANVKLQTGASGWVVNELIGPTPEDSVRAAAAKSKAQKAAADRIIAQQKAESDHRKYLAGFPTAQSGYTSIFVGSDRKCAQQFVEALSMEGIEKRKRLADLISYQCGFIDKPGVHMQKMSTVGGFCEVKTIDGERPGATGWVHCDWLRP